MKRRFDIELKRRLLIHFYLLLLCFPATSGYTQSHYQTREFWQTVSYRFKTQQMAADVRNWLLHTAWGGYHNNGYTNKLSEALTVLENLHNEYGFQDKIFRGMYISYNRNQERMRHILYGMCGSYRLANSTSDYIISKYSKDPKTIAIIKENEQAYKKEAEEEKRKKQIKLQQERLEDSLRQVEYENEKKLQDSLRAEKQKQKTLDSLNYIVYQCQNNIGNTRNMYGQSRYYNYPDLKWKGKYRDQNATPELWERYQKQHLQVPYNNIRKYGSVYISFTVDSTGTAKNIKIVKGIDSIYDQAAVDLVKSTSGKWKPANYKEYNSFKRVLVNQEMLLRVVFK